VAGYLEFTTGQVLTAAQVNDFLMEQAVMTFADAAARAAALSGVLREGILTYNEDTAQLEVYDGSAFVVAAPAPPAGIGSNVVQSVLTDVFSTSTSGFVPVTGLSATITPSSNTAKVLVIAQVTVSWQNVGAFLGAIRITGGNAGTYVGDAASARQRVAGAAYAQSGGGIPAGIENSVVPTTVVFLDSPASAAATTYTVEVYREGGVAYINRSRSDADFTHVGRGSSSITLIEVAV